jgi:hypothetical protein
MPIFASAARHFRMISIRSPGDTSRDVSSVLHETIPRRADFRAASNPERLTTSSVFSPSTGAPGAIPRFFA